MVKKLLWKVSAVVFSLAIPLFLIVSCGFEGEELTQGPGEELSEEPSDQLTEGPSAEEQDIIFGVVTDEDNIVVNGVEFDTDNAIITVDGSPGNVDDLKLGMIVKIKGKFHGDYTCNAATIVTDEDLKGPIDNIDIDNSTLTVLGQTVIVDSDTVFKKVTGLAGLLVGNVVEVHGFFDENGSIVASRLKKKAEEALPDDKFEVTGTIVDLDVSTGTFFIGALPVDYITEFAELPSGGIKEGDFVEVEGYLFNGTLYATEIELEDEFDFEEGDKLKIEGIITSVVGSQFVINGLTVEYSSSTEFKKGEATGLNVGIKVRVEGAIDDDGILIAQKIYFKKPFKKEPLRLKIKTPVSSIDSANNTLSFFNDAVTVLVTDSTKFENKKGYKGKKGRKGKKDHNKDHKLISFEYIKVGDFLDIRGTPGENEDIDIIAARVKLKKEKRDWTIQGPVGEIASSSITIMGVLINMGGNVEFEIEDDPSTFDLFFDYSELMAYPHQAQ